MSFSAASGSSSPILLGSDYLRSPPDTPKHLPDVSPQVCLDISAFKSLLFKYRKLDDAISTRMNRAHALAHRDPRMPYSELSPSECQSFYQDLQGLWAGRDRVLRYCTEVSEAHLQQEQRRVLGIGPRDPLPQSTAAASKDRRLDADPDERDRLYGEEVKMQQIRSEQSVEDIIRQRSLSIFFSRCRGFET